MEEEINELFNQSIWGKAGIVERAKKYNWYHDNETPDDGKSFYWGPKTKSESDKFKYDLDKLDFTGEDNLTKDKKETPCDRSIAWGIPNQIIGNPKEANFFVCLLNPRTRTDSPDNDNLKKYIIEENEEIIDNNPDNEKEYFKKIEKEGLDPYDKYIKHIINTEENVLEREVSDLKKDGKWKDNPEDLDSNFYKKYYYLHKYYNFIFRDRLNEYWPKDEGKFSSAEYNVFKAFRNGWIDPKDLKICNLELFPYRTNSGSGIKFKKDSKGKRYSYKDLDVSLFAAEQIVSRIENDLEENGPDEGRNKRLVFVFRSYTNWANTIKAYIASDKCKKQYGKIKFSDLEDYFYRFPNQSGSLSQNNIYKVKMPDDQYNNMQDILKPEKK